MLIECTKDNQNGWKWGKDGVQFFGEDAKGKAEAVGLSIKAADSGLLFDVGIGIKATIDGISGFLTAPVVLSRTGVQTYMGYELGLNDRAMDTIGVFRPPEEVFKPASLDSFANMVVTDDHPSEAVTVDNVKSLQKGQVSGITTNKQDIVQGLITITDKVLIDKIKSGKVEVSVGYGHDLKPQKGNFQGDDYEYIQTDIKGNHLAVVSAGRCGPACKLTIDHKEKQTMLITIDGIEFDVTDKQLGQAIQKQQASHDAKENAFIEKMKKAKEEKEEAEKGKDKAEAAKDAMSKDIMTTDQVNVMVTDRAKLIADVNAILGDKAPDCDCPTKARVAVIDHVFPDTDLSGKSDDYILATYDLAVEKHKAGTDSVDALTKDALTDDKGNKITRDSARAKYMETMGLN